MERRAVRRRGASGLLIWRDGALGGGDGGGRAVGSNHPVRLLAWRQETLEVELSAAGLSPEEVAWLRSGRSRSLEFSTRS